MQCQISKWQANGITITDIASTLHYRLYDTYKAWLISGAYKLGRFGRKKHNRFIHFLGKIRNRILVSLLGLKDSDGNDRDMSGDLSLPI